MVDDQIDEQIDAFQKEHFEDIYDVTQINKELEDEPEVIDEFTNEDYAEWYKKQLELNSIELNEFEKITSRNFDTIVDKYKTLVALDGKSYLDTTKMMFYSVMANQVKHNYFTSGANRIDLRMPLLLQLKAGHGKKNYERFIRKTIQGLGRQYQEPTSYHPEQFVGKIIVHEGKDEADYIPVFGTLASDFMVVDEAHALLTRKENEECLRYMRTALDPIGDNRIEKKQVNVPDENKLQYNPVCTILLFTQPISKVNEDLLVRGSFRRFIILFLTVTDKERRLARRDAEFLNLKEEVHNKIWESWIRFNKELAAYKDLKYVCHSYNAIDDYLDKLESEAIKMGAEVREFYNTSQFTIKQNLFKMAIIRAIVEHSDKSNTIIIDLKHITDAINDWDKIWLPQVQWIAGQLAMTSLYPMKWDENLHGLIVKELLKFDDKSIESTHLIARFKEENKNLTEANAKRKAYRGLDELKKWGFIKKSGQGKKSGYKITLIKEM